MIDLEIVYYLAKDSKSYTVLEESSFPLKFTKVNRVRVADILVVEEQVIHHLKGNVSKFRTMYTTRLQVVTSGFHATERQNTCL